MALKPLAVWTADNTAITADSNQFTADGADLINGGGTPINENAPRGTFNRLAYTNTVQLPN